MTPIIKAKKLFDLFFDLCWQEHKSTRTYKITSMSKSAAKKCALIAVDEIKKNIPKESDFLGYTAEYWAEVELELEKI